jgi:hypothetical protein
VLLREKKAGEIAGGLTTDTLAEDCDSTMRLHRIGLRSKKLTDAAFIQRHLNQVRQFMKTAWLSVLYNVLEHCDAVMPNPGIKILHGGGAQHPHLSK